MTGLGLLWGQFIVLKLRSHGNRGRFFDSELIMPSIALVLITLGSLFLVGLLADLVGRHTPLPRITVLLIAGFAIGPSAFNLLPPFTEEWFPVLTDIALAMVGFLLGQKLTLRGLKKLGSSILAISIGEVLVSALLTGSVLFLIGLPIEVALILAGVAPASAPAATLDIVRELRAKGRFTDALLDIVAIDDAWGLLLFSLLLAAAQAVTGYGGVGSVLIDGFSEVGGALLLGMLAGFPMAFFTGRVAPGEPSQAEALGWVLLCSGLAVWMEVSSILAAMSMGVVVANFARHHKRPFHAIEGIEWPFMILFFLLAGAALRIDSLIHVGIWGLAYIALRTLGLIIGAMVGGLFNDTDTEIRRWIGFALLPQAGVALGMVLLAAQRFPEFRDILVPIVLGSTVFFELVGPVITRQILFRVGDAHQKTT